MKNSNDEILEKSITTPSAKSPRNIDATVEYDALDKRLRKLVNSNGYKLVTDANGKMYACYRFGTLFRFFDVGDIENKKFHPRQVNIPKSIDPNGVLLQPAIATACKSRYDNAITRTKDSIARCRDIDRISKLLDKLILLYYGYTNGADRAVYAAGSIAIRTKAGDVDVYAEKIRRVFAYYIDESVNMGFDFKELAEELSQVGLSNTTRNKILKRLSSWLGSGYTLESSIRPVNAVVRADGIQLFKSLSYKQSEKTNELIEKNLALYAIDLCQRGGADEKRYNRLLKKAAEMAEQATEINI